MKPENRSTALQRRKTEAILEEAQKRKTARAQENEVEDSRILVSFSLGDEQYGIDAQHIEVIIEPLKIFQVPCVPEYIMGVINLRGEIISIIDLKRFFALPQGEVDDRARIIVVQDGGVKVGFLVDSVSGMAHVPVSWIQAPLSTIEKIKADYIDGEVHIDKRLLGTLNVENIIAAEERIRTGEQKEE
ncbi:chemotaxis protein CheW [Candidatus Poribacteria bacterium]|nr:chemotaxis protein CheW [Candidatus Poribacteria bacterium]